MSLEQFNVLLQINAQVVSLARNMRANANDYIRRANINLNPVALGVEMKADADAFLVRLAQVTAAASRNLPIVTAALALANDTPASVNADKNAMVASANHVKAATLTTKQQCLDEAAAIIAAIPNYEGLF